MAGQIPQHFIDDLLAKVDIIDVIDQRVSLKKSGSNYSACCPFHNEKTPSFTVSQTKQFYHCFGCSVNGNAISFLMEYEGMHFVDAIEALAESVGMEVPRNAQAAQVRDDSKPLYTLMESIASWYQSELRKSPEAIAYLKARGLSGETAKRFGIGYVPDGWDGLLTHFPKEEAAMIKTGMLIKGDGGKRPYQRFRNRIMFPIRDRRGRVIGFGGRVLDNQEPKYLNSPETPLFHKGNELYGLYEARKSAQDAAVAIVVEGYMDVVALAEHGVDNAVATLGTAANQQHSETLFRTVPGIVFCFDGDRAGRAAAWRALTATLPCLQDGHEAHFLFLPDGEDPDSIVKAGGAAAFQDLMSTRTPIIDYLYEHLASELDMTGIGGKATLAEKAKPLLASIPKGVYKQLALRRLESLIGISLGSERAAAPAPAPARARSASSNQEAGLTPMSRAILLCLQNPSVVLAVPPDDYEISPQFPGADILLKLIAYCDSEPTISTARLLERFRDTNRYEHLVKLATKSYYPDGREIEEEIARNEFAHNIARLRERSRQTLTDQVALSARTGLLAIKRR
ncbi:DNA primase [Granulosicoccus antarcticus]|uniref:DNA primase n=1 Tax=Granulosicoccus antarcticus IMCC3135 TaxID=1192854 RepID=A0A2Z2NIG6_9GAMM|nr:DNA primase [Granulosicoccus antarcticus]ASJ71126.1 DNA primase [Granulosicoccus antarcticus IMCC3135]